MKTSTIHHHGCGWKMNDNVLAFYRRVSRTYSLSGTNASWTNNELDPSQILGKYFLNTKIFHKITPFKYRCKPKPPFFQLDSTFSTKVIWLISLFECTTTFANFEKILFLESQEFVRNSNWLDTFCNFWFKLYVSNIWYICCISKTVLGLN